MVASRVGGLPALVEDGVTGFLVTPGDVTALTASIRRLAEDPALRASLGDRGRRAMERHRWPNVIAILEHVLNEVRSHSDSHQP